MRSTLAVIGVLALVAGCSSSGRSKSSDTVAGVTTVDAEIGAAQEQLGKTVGALQKVVEGPGSDLNPNYDAFIADLSSLDSKVQVIRDRALALQSKRDEYMKHWLEQTQKIQSAELKTQAEARRTQLMKDFMDLNSKGSTLKKAYAPVQAGLHDCQRFLESDLNPSGAKALAGELPKLTAGAKEVDDAVKEYRASLKVITDQLAVPAPAPAPPPK